MRVENIVSFEQTDEDTYTLTAFSDENPNPEHPDFDGHVYLDMGTYEAVRLYSLLSKTMGEYVREMESAKRDVGSPEWLEWRSNMSLFPDGYKWRRFRCTDPEGEWIREQADHARKAAKENQ